MKLRILLLTLALAGWTAFYGQSDSAVCLAPAEFDYFADALVERNGLITDTTIYCRQIRTDERIMYQQTMQLQILADKVSNRDTVIAFQKQAYMDLSVKYEKQSKSLNRSKNIGIGLLISTILFGTIVFLK